MTAIERYPILVLVDQLSEQLIGDDLRTHLHA